MKQRNAKLKIALAIAVIATAFTASKLLTSWSERLPQRGLEKIRLEAEIERFEFRAGRLMDGLDELVRWDGEKTEKAALREEWKKQLKEVDSRISELRKELDSL